MELVNLVAHAKENRKKVESTEEPEVLEEPKVEPIVEPIIEPEVDPVKEKEKPIESLELSNRSYNCLKRANINTIGQITAISRDDITQIRGLGEGTYNEIIEKIHARGLKFIDEEYMGSILQSGIEATKISSRTSSINEILDKIAQIKLEIEDEKEDEEKGEN